MFKQHLFRIFSLSIIVLFVFSNPISAEVLESDTVDEVVQESEQSEELVSTSNIYKADENVSFEGPIDGNIYAAGSTITLTGTVEKDVNLAGQTITISNAQVKGDLRAFGATVTIVNSTFEDEVFIGSGTTTIDENTKIMGTLYLGSGDSNINAELHSDAYLGTGTASIGSTITGDVTIAGGTVTLTNDASVQNITTVDGTTLVIGSNATISGEQKSIERSLIFSENSKSTFDKVLSQIFSFVSFLLLALLIGYYFPKQVEHVATNVKESPWKSTFLGIGVFFVLIVISIPLLISRIGWPILSVTSTILFGGLYIGRVFVSQLLGSLLIKSNSRFSTKQLLLLQITIGYLVIFLLIQIPIFGFLVSSFVATIGLGALLLKLKEFIDENKDRTNEQLTNTGE